MAKSVAVRARQPWYWRILIVGIPLVAGYALGYWHFSGEIFFQARATAKQMQMQSDALTDQVLLLERQLQIERATRSNAAKEMAGLQDEIMRLKEDVAFYKGILDESATAGGPRLHSVKLVKGLRPGEYRYRILLVQSGQASGAVRGKLQLALQAVQNGKTFVRNIDVGGRPQGIQVNFRHYQRIDGTFSTPDAARGQSLLVRFAQSDGSRPVQTQLVNLPE